MKGLEKDFAEINRREKRKWDYTELFSVVLYLLFFSVFNYERIKKGIPFFHRIIWDGRAGWISSCLHPTIWSTPSLISSEISEKILGVVSPLMLAEVDTIGFPDRLIKCLQNLSFTIRIAIEPSVATRLSAKPIAPSKMTVVGRSCFSIKLKLWIDRNQ